MDSQDILKPIIRKVSATRHSRVFVSFYGLMALCLLLSIVSPHFLTLSNVLNVLRQASITAIIALGMTYVILTGGIDLSVGSVLALTATVAGLLLKRGVNMFLAIGAAIVLGAALGFVSGILVTSRIKMPPFIATLAMMSIARGATLGITKGGPIRELPRQFGFIGGGHLFGVPVPVIIMLLLFLMGHIGLSRTKSGVYYYAVGGNQEAARLSGINIKKVKITAYVISGVSAALAGIVQASRLTSVDPVLGLGYELDAIAAAVIGGTSLSGGEGNLLGTLLGALTMSVLRNGLNLLYVSTYWQQVAIGIVIAITVSLATLRRE